MLNINLEFLLIIENILKINNFLVYKIVYNYYNN